MTKKIDFRKLGTDIALGKKGTGWMAIGESDLKEAKQAEGENKFDKFANWAEGWKETLQWEHEVGQHMKPLSEKTVDERIDQENDYILGYAEGMMEKENQLNKKKLKKVI
jgi:hypothetical protein